MKKRLDILGLGCTAVDDLLYVAEYPLPDSKTEVRACERQCGGLTATALVASARLGARCAYAGTLGTDDVSRFVLRCFKQEGVNVRQVVRYQAARPVQSVIIVDENQRTRNIFFSTKNAMGADAKRPSEDLIQSARVLLVDRFGVAGMIRAARIARMAGIPVVADFESRRFPRFAELLALADHLILSADFACEITGETTPAAAALELWRQGRSAVVVTCGADGCWVLDAPHGTPKHFPAFRVKALDTTGCGDVFHGAYAFALARGLPMIERIQLASATAALKATQHGGQAGIPNLATVESFLRRQRAS